MVDIINFINNISLLGIIVGLAWSYALRDVRGAVITLIMIIVFVGTSWFLDYCYTDDEDDSLD